MNDPIEEHPEYLRLKSKYGCGDCELRLVFNVYLDLCEVNEWKGVEILHQHELDLLYICGRPSTKAKRKIILPIIMEKQLSQDTMQQYFTHIPLAAERGITLAVIDADTTTAYYKISNGIIPPDSPEATEQKRKKKIRLFEDQRRQLEKDKETFLKHRENVREEQTSTFS